MILDISRSLWYLIARGDYRNWKQAWVTSHSPAVLGWRKLPVNRQELRCVNEAFAVGGMCRNCKSELGLTQFILGHVLEQESLVSANRWSSTASVWTRFVGSVTLLSLWNMENWNENSWKKTGFCSVNKEQLVWAHRGLLSQLSRQQRPKISSLKFQRIGLCVVSGPFFFLVGGWEDYTHTEFENSLSSNTTNK